jgi:hypothetical protein
MERFATALGALRVRRGPLEMYSRGALVARPVSSGRSSVALPRPRWNRRHTLGRLPSKARSYRRADPSRPLSAVGALRSQTIVPPCPFTNPAGCPRPCTGRYPGFSHPEREHVAKPVNRRRLSDIEEKRVSRSATRTSTITSGCAWTGSWRCWWASALLPDWSGYARRIAARRCRLRRALAWS